jgi:hypothetical protein
MPPKLKMAIRSRWFAACVHAALWLLLYLALTHLGGRAPEVRDMAAGATASQALAPVAALEHLYSEGGWPKSLLGTNASDPFFTRYFVPPAPPPPATTRKILVTYQGYYQTSDGPKTTIYKLDDAFHVAPVGARIATNLFLAEATMQALTLTNSAGQTNILPLNAKTELVVPIQ